MAYFCSLSFKDMFSFFLQKILTVEVATTIQDMTTTTIQDIIVSISVLCFSLQMTELLNFIKISINSY